RTAFRRGASLLATSLLRIRLLEGSAELDDFFVATSLGPTASFRDRGQIRVGRDRCSEQRKDCHHGPKLSEPCAELREDRTRIELNPSRGLPALYCGFSSNR